jgi:hypothetical protein
MLILCWIRKSCKRLSSLTNKVFFTFFFFFLTQFKSVNSHPNVKNGLVAPTKGKGSRFTMVFLNSNKAATYNVQMLLPFGEENVVTPIQ